MSKNKFPFQVSEVYLEFKTVMHSLVSTTTELEPYDFAALRQKVLAYHKEFGALNRAFYSVVDMEKGDFSWQHGIGEALGMHAKEVSLMQYIGRVHPDYLPMFKFWATAITEAAYTIPESVITHNFVYHISMPLRRADGSYHWYTQHSFAMQTDIEGRYLTQFNFHDYNGHWYAHNRSPMLPYVTDQNRPSDVLENMMFAIAAPRIRAFFTPTEQVLLEWYMKGEPPSEKLRMQQHTLYEHNSNIIKKVTAILLTDFKSARDAANLLLETKMWQIDATNTPI
jgi:hypothetical protein